MATKDTQKNKFTKTGKEWSPGCTEWCKDPNLKAVFFLDACCSLSAKHILLAQSDYKLLPYPKDRSKIPDDEVLSSVINFLLNNKILIKRGIETYFVTVDYNFDIDSNALRLLAKNKVDIKFIIITIPDLVLDQINLAIKGDRRWLRKLKPS